MNKFRTVLRIAMRSNIFITAFLFLMIFSALTTSTLTLINYLVSVSDFIKNKIEFPHSFTIIEISKKHECMQENCLSLPLYKVTLVNKELYISLYAILINNTIIPILEKSLITTYPINTDYSKDSVMLSKTLAEVLNISIGKNVEIILNNKHYSLKITNTYKFKGSETRSPYLILLLNTSPRNLGKANLYIHVIMNSSGAPIRKQVLTTMVTHFNSVLVSISNYWFALFIILYTVLTIFTFYKYSYEIRDDIESIIITGSSSLYVEVGIVFVLLSILAGISGVGLGLMAIDTASWIIRYMGVFFPTIPIITWYNILLIIAFSLTPLPIIIFMLKKAMEP